MLQFLQVTLVVLVLCNYPTLGQVNLATFQSETLAQHNVRRQQHCVPSLVLNSTLNTLAQNLANTIAKNRAFSFSGTLGLGENLWGLTSSGVIGYVNGSRAVEAFYAGSTKYNYSFPGYSSASGQFSQLIWRASKQIGVGIAYTNDSKGVYIVVNYYPGGNVNSAFSANVPSPCSGGTTVAPSASTTTVASTTAAPSINATQFQNEALVQHNFRRKKHCTPPLVLNATLNNIAQKYATYLAANRIFNHSQYPNLGENLWYVYSSAVLGYVNGSSSVESWYNETVLYNYASPGFSMATGHFTQVIWTDSTQLGVGMAFDSTRKYAYVVANYYPPGNYLGQFGTKVKPLC